VSPASFHRDALRWRSKRKTPLQRGLSQDHPKTQLADALSMAPALVAVSRRPAILAVELTQGQARRTRAFCAALIKSIPASQGWILG
jgi:hypothetical protein